MNAEPAPISTIGFGIGVTDGDGLALGDALGDANEYRPLPVMYSVPDKPSAGVLRSDEEPGAPVSHTALPFNALMATIADAAP